MMSVWSFFFFMRRQPPLSTRPVTLLPYTTLFRSLAVDDEGDHVGALRAAPGGGDHRAIEAAFGLENAGRIDEQDLRVVLERDAHQPRACGLRLGADDRDLLADQGVDERRLAGIGSADDGDKAAGLGHFTGSGNGETIPRFRRRPIRRSEEHTSELLSLMRI